MPSQSVDRSVMPSTARAGDMGTRASLQFHPTSSESTRGITASNDTELGLLMTECPISRVRLIRRCKQGCRCAVA